MKILFITASHKQEVLKKYLLKSKCIGDNLIIMKDYRNVCKAYNDAMEKITDEDIIVFCHHDVLFPPNWIKKLKALLLKLEHKDWGVLGLAGAKLVKNKQEFISNIKVTPTKYLRGGKIGKGKDIEEVETIDELCLIVKKENIKDFKWDEGLLNHFYGADICFYMENLGKKNYIINNCALHPGDTYKDASKGMYSDEFYITGIYMKEKHKKSFATTCCIVK